MQKWLIFPLQVEIYPPKTVKQADSATPQDDYVARKKCSTEWIQSHHWSPRKKFLTSHANEKLPNFPVKVQSNRH